MPFAMIVDWVEIYSRGRYRFIELSSDGDIINLLRWNPPLLDKSERAKMLTKDIRKLVGNED
ncbi:MAG: hypothetical protein GWN31_14455 [Candidatus Thorarchaeota archaeon]|nr:hypothetical protein [Candidatus Thorarchaeota archaeon]